MKNLILIFVFSLFISPVSKAGVLVEPYLDYQFGNYSFVKTPASVVGVTQSGTLNGLAAGLRLAYLLEIPFIGLDYSYGWLTDKSSNNTTENATLSIWYAIIGLNLPAGLEIYGGYAFQGSLNTKVTGFPVTHTGVGYKIGASYAFFKPLHLGLEYTVYNSQNFSSPAGNFTTSNEYSTSTCSSFIFTVSAPFTF